MIERYISLRQLADAARACYASDNEELINPKRLVLSSFTVKLITILSALLTPTIAIITTYIAVQQYRSNRLNNGWTYTIAGWQFYIAAVDFIRTATINKHIESRGSTYDNFYGHVQESYFLFDQEMYEYLRKIYISGEHLFTLVAVEKHGVRIPLQTTGPKELVESSAKLQKQYEEEDRKNTEKREELDNWLREQHNFLQGQFEPYLKLAAMK